MDKREKLRRLLELSRLDRLSQEITAMILSVIESYDKFDQSQRDFFRARRETIEIEIQNRIEHIYCELASESNIDALLSFHESEPAKHFKQITPEVKNRVFSATEEILKELIQKSNPPE